MEFLFLISVLFNLLLMLSSTVTQTEDHPPFLYTVCYGNRGTDSANRIYHTNLNQILADLISTDNGYGFYNTSSGQNPNKAYAIGLCRGDVKPYACRKCLDGVRNFLIEACPSQIEAIGWYQNCMLRFSNRSLHGSMEVVPAFSLWKAESLFSGDEVAARFNRRLRNLLKTLSIEAAGGGDLSKFAAGSASFRVARNSNQLRIYALVQCTPDLSETVCKRCLLQAFGHIPKCCHGKDTGRLVTPSCNLRFELSSFFDKAATAVSNGSPPPSSANTRSISLGIKNKKLRNVMIFGIASIVGVLGLYMCFCCLRVYRKEKGQPSEPVTSVHLVTKIPFDAAKSATGNFDETRKLGQGGFGPVYKGHLEGRNVAVKRLSMEQGCLDGQDIAVKILSTEQQRQAEAQFSAEVAVLGNLQHDNLVKLLHFCVEGNERVLVYEFVPNGSLDRLIFDKNVGKGLDWGRRYNIIVGTAQGICYLHHNASPTFIHRDVKSSNILVDAEWNPKISDLGLAKLFSEDRMEQYTIHCAGTRGYMAPEYVHLGRYSVKSDVYAFGVVILEIVRGEKNSSFSYGENGRGLVNYAWENCGDEERVSNLIDPMLRPTVSDSEIRRCLEIALLCLQENEDKRPTMVKVVDMLTSNHGTDTLPDPVRREQEPVLSVLEPQQALQAVSRSVGSELGNTPITTNSGVVPVSQAPVENNAYKMLASAPSSVTLKVSEFHRTRAPSPPKICPKQRPWIN